MDSLITLLTNTFVQVIGSFLHNWPFLIMSILIAVLLKLYVDPAKVSAFLMRNRRAGVVGATLAAVGTPLCSCGTTAIVLGMMAGSLPWAPLIAFMVSSPLTSPEGLVYSAGLFGWPFAIAYFAASILLGLFGGMVAGILENRGFFKNQARFQASPESAVRTALAASAGSSQTGGASAVQLEPAFASAGSRPVMALSNVRPPIRRPAIQLASEPLPAATAACSCTAAVVPAPASACGCGAAPTAPVAPVASSCGCGSQPVPQKLGTKVTMRMFLTESWNTARRLLPMFLGFAFIGFFLNSLIPDAWVSAVFGAGNAYSVPLAATLGVPLYINSEASLPLIRSLIDGGMSQGAALAFLITGSGTSIGAVMGALTIARWRVIAVVVAVLWVGAIVTGSVYNLAILAGLI